MTYGLLASCFHSHETFSVADQVTNAQFLRKVGNFMINA